MISLGPPMLVANELLKLALERRMSGEERDKYRNLELLRGGVSLIRGRRRGRRVGTAAELFLDREMLTAFAALEDASGNVPSEAIQKVREGVQHPWRFLARRFVDMHRARVQKRQAKAIVQTLDVWLDRLYDDALTTGEFPRAA